MLMTPGPLVRERQQHPVTSHGLPNRLLKKTPTAQANSNHRSMQMS